MAIQSWFLSADPSLEELIEAQRKFRLREPAHVEKDFFVIKALAAIFAIDKGPFQLIFQGGTALSRGHRVIDRMSEDIDIKIVSEKKPTEGALKTLRNGITDSLLAAGFKFDPSDKKFRNTMYRGSYVEYRLPYKAEAEGRGPLRPEIKIETSAWPMRRAPVERPIVSFVAEAFGRDPEIAKVPCAAIQETGAEKLVALTRRAGAYLAGVNTHRDNTLVRHIYDLHRIRPHYDQDEVAALASEVMADDAKNRGDEFPAYAADPLGETLKAVAAIEQSAEMAEDYRNLLRDMVYGEEVSFEAAFQSVKELADRLK
jgi:predicted nucleotidyltransferase component of viral defense system